MLWQRDDSEGQVVFVLLVVDSEDKYLFATALEGEFILLYVTQFLAYVGVAGVLPTIQPNQKNE